MLFTFITGIGAPLTFCSRECLTCLTLIPSSGTDTWRLEELSLFARGWPRGETTGPALHGNQEITNTTAPIWGGAPGQHFTPAQQIQHNLGEDKFNSDRQGILV